MRVRINGTPRGTPEKTIKSKDYFPNQKLRHAEVKAKKSHEHLEYTPVRKSFLGRRSSLRKNSVKFNSYITPLSSTTKDNLSVLIRSSSSSSGYHSLKNSTESYKKNHDGFIAPFRRRLNCDNKSFQHIGKSVKITKCRLYDNMKQTNNLPPRAMPNLSGMSSSFEIWNCMIQKEHTYKRDPNYFVRQKYITSEMRSVLLDWMLEVCEAYSMDLETFYLSVDYLDRYMSYVSDIPTHVLQALGTTTLYIASKLHEITPPSLENFVSVTDGACTEREILIHEAHILLKINWNLQPITPLSWLCMFLQIAHSQDLLENNENNENNEYKGPLTRMRYLKLSEDSTMTKKFMLEKIDSRDFQYYLKTLNSCIMDQGSLRFSYRVVSASILHLTTNIDVFEITGFGLDEISGCIKWLKPHIKLINKQRSTHNEQEIPILQDCTNRNNEINNIPNHKYSYSSYNDLANSSIEYKENIPPLQLIDAIF